MEYRIIVKTNKGEEGIFWCILDENDCNSGFGYADTLDGAFSEAKHYYETCLREKEGNNSNE